MSESIVERYFGDVQGLSDIELRDLRGALDEEHARRQAQLTITEEERDAWRRGNKITAIKMLRERLGLGLCDAKVLLENHA